MFEVAIILITMFFLSETKNIVTEKCYDSKPNFYPYFATRTAYQFVRGNITRPNSDYKPLQIWMMSRHGVRYPKEIGIKQMKNLEVIRDQIVKNHMQGAGELCAEDLEKLRQWKLDFNFTIALAGRLCAQGQKDLQKLTQRLRHVFPELLKSNNASDYLFTSTIRPVTANSLKVVATELLGSSTGFDLDVPHVNNSIMLPFQNCPYLMNTFEFDLVFAERDKFLIGPEIQQLLKDLSKRLGYSKTIDVDMANFFYEVCRHETACDPSKLSVWCRIFSKDELMMLEYSQDLDLYYCCGPDHKNHSRLACPQVRNMFEHFEQIVNGKSEDEPKGVFFFSHTVNFQSLLSALHIGRGPAPILASTFESSKNRVYRTSFTGPFNANLVAVLYKYNGVISQYKVIFYLNENLVKMDGCDNGICDWQFLKQKFGPEVESCTLDFCYEGLTKI